MPTISERLQILRGDKSRRSFADFLGIPPSTLKNYEQGDTSPPLETLELVCEKMFISRRWLLLGEGTMRPLEIEENKKQTPLVSVNETTCDVDIIMIPMADARLSAGCGSLEADATSERKYGFRSDFLHRKGSPNNMVLMRVSGDSMSPEIEDNDVVLLDQSKKDITPGRLYAVGFEEAIYLKRIDMLPGKVVLKSTNPAYPPVELDINGDCEELFRVIGRVLWCGREYK